MSNPNIAELGKATRFPINRKDHTTKGPYFKPLFERLAKEKWPMQSPTGELINMKGDIGLATALWWEGLRGDVNAIREIMDRMDGKTAQKLIGEGFENRQYIIIRADSPKAQLEAGSVRI